MHIFHIFLLALCLLALCLIAEKSLGKAKKKETLNLVLYVSLVSIKNEELTPKLTK